MYPSATRPTGAPWLAEQVAALADLGVPVAVLCCSPFERDHDAVVRSNHHDIPVHYRSTSAGALNGTRLGLLVSTVRYLASARSYLRANRDYDVLHAHFAFPDAYVVTRIGRRLGLPVVVTLHGSDVAGVVARSGLFARRVRHTLAKASQVICVSSDLECPTRLALPGSARTTVIPNGYNEALFSPPAPDAPRDLGYLYVGNLLPVKNVQLLVDTYLSTPDLHGLPLTVIGEGPLRATLEKAVSSSPVWDRVRFTGALPREAVADAMRRSRALILPSEREGFGVVAAEALACGTPVVASRVGALPELLADERAGILIDPGDPDALRDAMRRIADWPHQATVIAASSGARRWAVRAEEVAAVYRALA
jgi:glycosyltransferase involved in cell wall biosynthesis